MSGEDWDDCCMVFDRRGNAFDAFEYAPEALIERAAMLRGTATIAPSPFVTGFTSGLWVEARRDRSAVEP